MRLSFCPSGPVPGARFQQGEECIVLPHFVENRLTVIKIIRKGGIDLSQGNVGESCCDLLRRFFVDFRLRIDILDSTPSSN